MSHFATLRAKRAASNFRAKNLLKLQMRDIFMSFSNTVKINSLANTGLMRIKDGFSICLASGNLPKCKETAAASYELVIGL